ncbi:MAG: PilZ domain-containing protein [Deltaproteobacteria bacterium]|nr:PilZ domain-containing protein [Deltaproteobacteria bacterium]
MNNDERRKNPRVEAVWPLKIFKDDLVIDGESKNISIDGIQICCEHPLYMNERIRISVFPPNSEGIAFTGEVVWSDFYGLDADNKVFGIGVCMVELAEEDQKMLEELLMENIE